MTRMAYKRGRNAIHVAPSRLCRVTKTHIVKGELNKHEGARDDLEQDDACTANPGDLVLEIARARDIRVGEPVEPYAHTYLSGNAVQVMSYETASEWLEDAGPVWLVTIPDPRDYETAHAFNKALAGAVLAARYGIAGDDPDARPPFAAFDLRVAKSEFEGATNTIWELLHYAPTSPEVRCTTHICGIIRAGRRRGPHSVFHVQPPADAQKWSATPFAIQGLALLAKRGGVRAPVADDLKIATRKEMGDDED